MVNCISKIVLLFILFSTLVLPNFALSEENLEESCLLLADKGCQNIGADECRKQLEKCEEYYNKETAKIEADLSKTEQEKKTLQNKVYSLNQKVKNLNYQISQSNLIIKDLGFQIQDTKSSIETTSSEIENSREMLADILRTIYEEEQRSVIEVLLSGEELSDFFDNLVALDILNSQSRELLQGIKILKGGLEKQEQSLTEEKGDLEQIVRVQSLQKEKNNETKKEQEYYLKITEEEYQKQLQEKEKAQKKAADIRARIFELIGVSEAPTFGEALELAKSVEEITGVRPALLLAVLTQESNIGKNVGQCYLKDPDTGDGVVARSGAELSRVMSPKRDVPPFLKITKELGRDPYETLVSCPMSFGWGGAMGPAQFIPSTWISYKDRLKTIKGKPADPWNIKDAFLAAALYLSDYGAAKQTYDGEWKAAMIYFSGSTNTRFRFYGDSVMEITAQYDKDIAAIEKGN
ncbi:lytic murein transglycosylase [Patescibacteria group bacterium]|nr:lytic murein transglycosylase [Patescibacteria group bacterium]